VSDWYEDDVDHTDDGAEPDEDELFDWDDGNLYKLDDHRLTVEETQEACLDPDRKPAQAYSVDNERRAALVGATHSDRILFVLYTIRFGRIRVISARIATKDEQRKYWRQ
jgi:uncharacterized DUF497 family protein